MTSQPRGGLGWRDILTCWVQSACLKYTREMFLSSTNELCTAILICWEERKEEKRRSDLAYQFEEDVPPERSSLSEAEQQRIGFSHGQDTVQAQCSSQYDGVIYISSMRSVFNNYFISTINENKCIEYIHECRIIVQPSTGFMDNTQGNPARHQAKPDPVGCPITRPGCP